MWKTKTCKDLEKDENRETSIERKKAKRTYAPHRAHAGAMLTEQYTEYIRLEISFTKRPYWNDDDKDDATYTHIDVIFRQPTERHTASCLLHIYIQMEVDNT